MSEIKLAIVQQRASGNPKNTWEVKADFPMQEDDVLYPAAAYEALQKELTHWKANHADLKERLHVATHRTDIPNDRLPLFDEMKADIEALQKENAELIKDQQHYANRADLSEKTVGVLQAMNAAQAKRIAELEEDLQFVELWANHHGTKQNITAQEALSCIQHYPSIAAITKSYKDGVIPSTRNPYAEIEAQEERIAKLEAAKPKMAPVQGYVQGIPWDMHLEAYNAYRKKYGAQQALIEGGCRGGFGVGELDMFIPGWREKLSLVGKLNAEIESLRKQVEELLGASRIAITALAHTSQKNELYDEAYERLDSAISFVAASKNGE